MFCLLVGWLVVVVVVVVVVFFFFKKKKTEVSLIPAHEMDLANMSPIYEEIYKLAPWEGKRGMPLVFSEFSRSNA